MRGVAREIGRAAISGVGLALTLMLMMVTFATCVVVLTVVYAVVVVLAHVAGLDLPGWPTGG